MGFYGSSYGVQLIVFQFFKVLFNMSLPHKLLCNYTYRRYAIK